MSEHHLCAGVCRGQQRTLDPSELELQVVVRSLRQILGVQLGLPWEQQVLLPMRHLSRPHIHTNKRTMKRKRVNQSTFQTKEN